MAIETPTYPDEQRLFHLPESGIRVELNQTILNDIDNALAAETDPNSFRSIYTRALKEYMTSETFVRHFALMALGIPEELLGDEERLKDDPPTTTVWQSPSQIRTASVVLHPGVLPGAIPFAPMSISVKGIGLTLEKAFARVHRQPRANYPEPASRDKLRQHLTGEYEPHGLFGHEDANKDQEITDFYAKHGIPVGRSLGTMYIDYTTVTRWLKKLEARYKDSIFYPFISNAQTVVRTNGHILTLHVRLDDDGRYTDYSFTDDPNSIYSPSHTISRAARSFLTEMLWMGNGDLAAGEEAYLRANDFDTRTLMDKFNFAEAMTEIFRGNITKDYLQTFMLFVAHRIGRTAGRKYAIRDVFYRKFGRYPQFGHTTQDESLRGVEHDFEKMKFEMGSLDRPKLADAQDAADRNVDRFFKTMYRIALSAGIPTDNIIPQNTTLVTLQGFTAGKKYSPS